MNFKISPGEAKKQLLEENELPFTVVMKHGTMSVEYFAPDKVDTQTPHKQDEIYVIIEGDGFFFRDGQRIACKKGDILFVPTGMEHRFENFSDDFAVWVIFYGPDGGEKNDLAFQ